MIKNKMAFSMMRSKLTSRQYNGLADLNEDVDLIVKNCCTFNMVESIFYKVATQICHICIICDLIRMCRQQNDCNETGRCWWT